MEEKINIDLENPKEVTKFLIARDNKQGEAIVEALERVEQVEENVEKIEENVTNMYIDMDDKIRKLEENTTINDAQQYVLKYELVYPVGRRLAQEIYGNEYFQLDDKERKNLHGSFYRKIWTKLKKRYGVPRWYLLLERDYINAKEFVYSLKLKDFLD